MTNSVRRASIIGIGLLIVVAGSIVVVRGTSLSERQARVRIQGQQIMPFDLNQTTHSFATTPTGGVETVVAKDPTNVEQIRLIQTHLSAEIARFQAGDFADPAAIHGQTMPGLVALERGAAAIAFRYTALPAGAQISYTTSDSTLVAALHDWFMAQQSDHGADAMSH